MNIFQNSKIAKEYDSYYTTEMGSKIDAIEKELISDLITDISTGNMLELGCGTGHWTNFFIEKGFSITGIDTSEAMLDIAKQKKLNAEFKIGNAQKIPFKDESFSAVSAITMLEFVNDQNKVIEEIYRVLKPKGWLILGGLNKNSVLGINKENDETFKNANFLTVEELKEKLSKFSSISIKSGVYLNNDFNLIEPSKNNLFKPVFIGVIAQKN